MASAEPIGRTCSEISLESLPVPDEHQASISEGSSDEREIQEMANIVGRMEVTNPEVLRVTPVWRAFERQAEALRMMKCDFYDKSEKSQEIPTFWSHSWHSGPWKKILTLMLFYNGTAAVTLGSFLAISMTSLFAFSPLPGWYGITADFRGYAAWGLFSGALLTSSIMIFWRPQQCVFFDGICISKNDRELKSESVKNLAGFLTCSQSFLVIWDPTWTERLWCLFEMGAFLKSMEQCQNPKTVIVQPVFMGPVYVTGFLCLTVCVAPLTMMDAIFDEATDSISISAAMLICGTAGGCICVSYLREYFRNLDTMKQQLLALSFDTARCTCCDAGHMDLAGNEILCDRKILRECMTGWFGSQEAFEEIMRSQVLAILDHDLDERVFSTKWLLGGTIPIWWGFMDNAAGLYALRPMAAVRLVLCGTAIWLLAPATARLLTLLCKWMRAKSANQPLNVMKNILPLCAPAAYLFSTFSFMVIDVFLPASFTELARAGVFVACQVAYSLLIHCLIVCLKAGCSES